MKINLTKIKVRELTEGYTNLEEEGIVGYGGKLNIRPKYQREFIYKDKQRNAVIETIRKGFPLNMLYWAKHVDSFELVDGQQRTISICEYIKGNYSVAFDSKNPQYFHGLSKEEQNQILDYELLVGICEGTEKDTLDWFKTINISNEPLTAQELLNAIYTGPWLTDAKSKFSSSKAPAKNLADKYIKGSPIRQEYLEKALGWISNGNIEEYMAKYRYEQNANELWLYFKSVIEWAQITFRNYRMEMKSVDWGILYNTYKNTIFNTDELETKIKSLLIDPDVTKKSGVYKYVLTGDERALNIRAFNEKDKIEAYERQKGICPKCKKHFDMEKMEADHITPWCEGGRTVSDNCQMLCKNCNRHKSSN